MLRKPMKPNLRLALILLATIVSLDAAQLNEGVRHVQILNYPDCTELFNASTRIVIGHHVGGRVLSYRLGDREALFLSPDEAAWKNSKRKRPLITAGRFDIGPEFVIPRRNVLWSGEWQSEIIGPRAVRVTSRPDPGTGVQLVREFRLAAEGSQLECRQIIRNISKQTKYWCHWSRTFALHGGVAIIPLSPDSKFPKDYVMYEGRGLINVLPSDPNITRVGDYLLVTNVPAFPKLGFDSKAGWFAYQMKNDLLFVKRYATHPDAVYNEVAGLTLSIWYPPSTRIEAVELEPIAPRNTIAPGASAEFTEYWTLFENSFAQDFSAEDLDRIAKRISAEAAAR